MSLRRWHKNLAKSKGVFDLYETNNTLTRKKHYEVQDSSRISFIDGLEPSSF